MKRIYNILLCFLIGCTSIPTATEENPTLLVGEIVLLSDYVSNQEISFKGTTISDIAITLRNTANNETFRIVSNSAGLFHINLQEGKYLIDELYIKKEQANGAWSYFYTNPAPKVFEIKKGKVNNIGTINWSYIERRHNVIQTDNSISVKANFLKKYPKSNWNQREWEFSQLALETIQLSGENVSYYVKTDDGLDSTRITLPKEIQETERKRIELEIKKRMSDYRSQGDTTYYVKSENGLDSVSLTLPKAMSEEQKQNAENHVRRQMQENRSRIVNSDNTIGRVNPDSVVLRTIRTETTVHEIIINE